jgi:CDP-6-deoxy-D-xylo-4-hexulose-3-dehydrase
MSPDAGELRSRILDLVSEYHDAQFGGSSFVPGETPIRCSGRVFDAEEMVSLADSALDFWLTTGRFAERFENELAELFGLRKAILVNSGSSANLVAVSALTSRELGDERLRPGDEAITVAAGFPTTVNPLIQNGLLPVFVDVSIPTYNADVDQIEAAVTPRTRAIVLAHTLGNPFDAERIAGIAERHGLWLIEDCCDALGSTFAGRGVGTFGKLATTSFYPAHHITTGEGGAVLTSSPRLGKLAESFRDWGRDCWCAPGDQNTCGKRFEHQLGTLPQGYDHKYVYSHIGYNLKLTDMQAAVGVAQMRKLPRFIETRRRNFAMLRSGLEPFEEFLLLPEPTPRSEPSWFGFPVGVRSEAPFSRLDLIRHLQERKIDTRLLFAGNIIRQPAYAELEYRVVGELDRTDWVMNQVFWIGVYPGLTPSMIEYVVETFAEFARGL